MLTNEDVLKDTIKTLEGQLKYSVDGWEKVKSLTEENKTLQAKIVRLEKQIKHLMSELEEL
jgi:predicted RNase H-like nuclease (RuvC/YqgF family)